MYKYSKTLKTLTYVRATGDNPLLVVKVLLKVGQPGQIPLPVTGSVVVQAANEDIRGRGSGRERQ